MTDYYTEVGKYYDQDAPEFEERYNANRTLQIIRNSFRNETEKLDFNNALEIGFGPGVDLVYFSNKYPDRSFFGIDISAGMYQEAQKNADAAGVRNVNIVQGTVEDLETLFPGEKFDLIYVYFGALNTVKDLAYAADCLDRKLKPGGKIVLTVINKWYLAGMLLPMLKLKFSVAFRRLKKTWGGYSPKRELKSYCYSPADIRRAFKNFRIKKRRGYSILYPAWYQDNIREKLGKISDILWKTDRLLSKTPFWKSGEYMLFVMERK